VGGKMTKNENAFIVSLLDDLLNYYDNDSCNDIYIDDTPDNRQLYLDSGGDSIEDALQVPPRSKEKTKKIAMKNNILLNYLRSKFMKENGLENKEIFDLNEW
jgi:hypothetical protein